MDLAVRLEGLPPQCVQPFLQANFKRFLLIAQRVDFTVRADLEIQLHSGLVIVVGQVQILPANLLLIPTPFVLVGLCRAVLNDLPASTCMACFLSVVIMNVLLIND